MDVAASSTRESPAFVELLSGGQGAVTGAAAGRAVGWVVAAGGAAVGVVAARCWPADPHAGLHPEGLMASM